MPAIPGLIGIADRPAVRPTDRPGAVHSQCGVVQNLHFGFEVQAVQTAAVVPARPGGIAGDELRRAEHGYITRHAGGVGEYVAAADKASQVGQVDAQAALPGAAHAQERAAGHVTAAAAGDLEGAAAVRLAPDRGVRSRSARRCSIRTVVRRPPMPSVLFSTSPVALSWSVSSNAFRQLPETNLPA